MIIIHQLLLQLNISQSQSLTALSDLNSLYLQHEHYYTNQPTRSNSIPQPRTWIPPGLPSVPPYIQSHCLGSLAHCPMHMIGSFILQTNLNFTRAAGNKNHSIPATHSSPIYPDSTRLSTRLPLHKNHTAPDRLRALQSIV
jgi:hypothetical protein